MTGNTNLDSIILDIRNGQKTVEDLKTFLKENEVIISTQIFKYALKCPQATKEAVIHEILLHFVQNSNKQSLEDVIEYLYHYKKLHALLDFQDNEGNTLLHYAALHGQCKDITALIKYDANPLIKNMNNQIPLDLAQEKAKKVLIEGMRKQASSKKVSSRYHVLGLTFAVSPLAFFVFGFCAIVAAECDVVSFPNAILGAIIASPFIGIAAGLITYSLDQDRKQAKAIEMPLALLEEAEVSEKSPLLQPSMQS